MDALILSVLGNYDRASLMQLLGLNRKGVGSVKGGSLHEGIGSCGCLMVESLDGRALNNLG